MSPLEWRRTRAREELDAALAGVELTDYERRVIDWLGRWEPDVVEAVLSLVRKVAAKTKADNVV